MHFSQSKKQGLAAAIGSSAGFTLVELMVAMVVGLIVTGVIFGTHNLQQKTFRQESLKLAAIQNARAALFYMEQELRLAGYDRPNSGLFGLTDVRLDASNNARITFTLDMGAGGNADNGSLDADETITYLLYDSPTTTGPCPTDLGRTVNGTTELVAECIEAMGLVYAFDSDNDDRIDWNDVNADDIKQPGEGEFWAVDTDGDNLLDTNLDTNFDGIIDENDTLFGAALPTLPGGGSTVPSDRIRAVKVMLLAQSKTPDLNHQDTKSYQVGFLPPIAGNSYHRRLLTTTVRCRNLGL